MSFAAVLIVAFLGWLAVFGVGLVVATNPLFVATLRERIDSIGSTTYWYDVRPANWHVLFVKLLGIFLVLTSFAIPRQDRVQPGPLRP